MFKISNALAPFYPESVPPPKRPHGSRLKPQSAESFPLFRLRNSFRHSNIILLRCQNSTYTLLAHLVTFLPSFKQSISPLPLLSLLHCMKSSLYGLHLAPIKKLADSNGAELLPISVTGGISAGRGVVSMRVVWLNLKLRLIRTHSLGKHNFRCRAHLGCLPAILSEVSQVQQVRSRLN